MLPQLFNSNFKKFKDKIAIIYKSKKYNYNEIFTKIKDIEKILMEEGIVKGEKVILKIKNPVVFIVYWMALWNHSCVIIPLEPKVNNNEVNKSIVASGCSFIIESDEKTDNISYRRVSNKASDVSMALYFYTSGTTGTPKCVTFSHESMHHNVISLNSKLGLCKNDVLYSPVSPMLPATLTTVVLPSFSVGATLVLDDTTLPRKIIKIIKEHRVTIFFAIPFIYNLLTTAIATYENLDFGSIRIALTSSAYLEPHIFEQFYKSTMIPIRSIYCSSECGAITYTDSSDIEEVKNTVGKPLKNVKIKIAVENEMNTDAMQVGEIMVQSLNASNGYYNKPELNELIYKNLWIKTGDLGVIDDKGNLVIKGRKSDTVNVSGYLVNPKEIETVILEYEGIEDLTVFGEKDEVLGEKICAQIIMKEGVVNITLDELQKFCVNRLQNYKIPRKIEIVEKLERGRYGKKIRT